MTNSTLNFEPDRRHFLALGMGAAAVLVLPGAVRAAGEAADIRTLAFDGDTLLIAGATLRASLNDGRSWHERPTPSPVSSIATHPARPGRLLAGLARGGVAVSGDGGSSWTTRSDGLASGEVTALAVAAGNPDMLYAAIRGDGLWKSEDAGATWALAMDRPWLDEAERDPLTLASVDLETGMGGILAMMPVAVFALIGAGFYWGLFNGDDTLASPLIGKAVPEFDLPPIEGLSKGLSTADLKGQVSLVNVWASWCVPCRVEMPLLNELAARDEVAIFGINYKDRPEEALGFLAELGDPYTRIGADRNGRVSIDWGVYGLPETFVIDAEGRIAYKHIGPFNRRSLEEVILPVVRRLQEGTGS